MRGLPLKAFPLGGRWHGEAVTDEGAMIEKFRSLQGSFAAPAASDFLDAQKVTKKAPGGGRNRRFGRASRLHAARPLEPPLRGLPLGPGRIFPARKIWVAGLNSRRATGPWLCGKLRPVRFHICAWLCRANMPGSTYGIPHPPPSGAPSPKGEGFEGISPCLPL